MGNSQQVQAGTPLTVTEMFSVAGVAADASGLPTLTLTRPDGTAYTPVPTVLDAWAGPPARATGEYRFVLPKQSDPYYLDYKLAGVIGGQPAEFGGRVEWVGAYLFNFTDLRNYVIPGTSGPAFTNSTTYPDAKIHEVRRTVLGEFTKRLGFSPVPRYAYEVHSLADRGGGGAVVLRRLFAHRVLSVSVAGVAQAATNYSIGEGGTLLPVSGYAPTSWSSSGVNTVTVGYLHGWPEFEDDDGKQAALTRAAMLLNPGMSSTMTSYASPDGGSYTWDRVGTRNAAGDKVYFGVGSIAEWINEHKQHGLAVA